MIDLCECFLALFEGIPDASKDTVAVSVRCVMKAAMSKEKDEKTQKEVEMALLALSNAKYFDCDNRVQFLDESVEIIKYHQEHHNLTRLAYQSAWCSIVNQASNDEKMGKTVENELNFCKEAERELDELLRCVNWRKNEKEIDENFEVRLMKRWLRIINAYFFNNTLRGDEVLRLIACVVRLCQTVKNSSKTAFGSGMFIFQKIIRSCLGNVDFLLRRGAMDYLFQELIQPTFRCDTFGKCMQFFSELSIALHGEKVNTNVEDDESEDLDVFEWEGEGGQDDKCDEYNDCDENGKEIDNDEVINADENEKPNGTDEAKKMLIKRVILNKSEEEGDEDIIFSFET
ncbi:uncharacterized protein MONOS_1873 [Monocercomonoides exilis]|uniref:uncharacterized protein n=1 Tax=Monocercomonoides exilis TaxID=2049356 RepID=UPI0035597847|nr:hypothetical protein MONOS_1873 [Monocercomonoides exilis]|eukprot:MONOS_1873.1-p1 / transcript=MONOS_1873.1 / gene=MONOS_1873 / organism=Monocercomonoides_exilis_PA203 / gene_product=unspecified product / transcript_product=unspecified product / location=Mono_scaffold00035:151329-152420(+) / protein_length=344 / sequence_SO=supercontig / SO=protein_coding / is_pseudo=false